MRGDQSRERVSRENQSNCFIDRVIVPVSIAIHDFRLLPFIPLSHIVVTSKLPSIDPM